MAFVLESGCKGIAFFDTVQDFSKEKCNIYIDFNTCLHNMRCFVGAHIVFITRERKGWEEDKTNEADGTDTTDKTDKTNKANGADKTDKTNGVDKAD